MCGSTAAGRASRRWKQPKNVTASSKLAETIDAPTRSKGAIEPGAREETVMRSVALDLGKRKISYCEVNDGQVIQRLTISQIETLEAELGVDQASAVVAIEAHREAWHVYDLLTSWGNKVLVVDTTRVRRLGVGQHGRKTDRVDAEVLALAVERGGIPVAHLLSPARRELRRWLGVRRGLVETRAQMITTALGQPLKGCVVKLFLTHVRRTTLSPEVSAVLAPLLKTIETVNDECDVAERRLAALAAEEPVIGLLTTVPGVATIVASAFVSVIDDAGRFEHAHQVESYLGLVPGENSSGGKRRVGAITKQGNRYVRALLIQSAWTILRQDVADDPLRKWAQVRRNDRSSAFGITVQVVSEQPLK